MTIKNLKYYWFKILKGKVPCDDCGIFVLPITYKKTNGKCMPCKKKDRPFFAYKGTELYELTEKDIQAKAKTLKLKIEQDKKNHISRLNSDLSIILEKEISAGNKVDETSSEWPIPDAIFILLEKPFITDINDRPDNVEYTEMTDTRYWKAELFETNSKHILACRF